MTRRGNWRQEELRILRRAGQIDRPLQIDVREIGKGQACRVDFPLWRAPRIASAGLRAAVR